MSDTYGTHVPGDEPAPPVIVQMVQPAPKAKTHHLFHLIMCVPTGGLWVFVWAYRIVKNRGI